MSKIFKLCNELRNEFIKNRESTLYSVMQLTKNEINQDRYLNLNPFLWMIDNSVYESIELMLIEVHNQ